MNRPRVIDYMRFRLEKGLPVDMHLEDTNEALAYIRSLESDADGLRKEVRLRNEDLRALNKELAALKQPDGVKRYRFSFGAYESAMEEDASGEWVRYEDIVGNVPRTVEEAIDRLIADAQGMSQPGQDLPRRVERDQKALEESRTALFAAIQGAIEAAQQPVAESVEQAIDLLLQADSDESRASLNYANGVCSPQAHEQAIRHLKMARDGLYAAIAAEQQKAVEQYQQVCAIAYQFAGALNAPVAVLDMLGDVANGEIGARVALDDVLPVNSAEIEHQMAQEHTRLLSELGEERRRAEAAERERDEAQRVANEFEAHCIDLRDDLQAAEQRLADLEKAGPVEIRNLVDAHANAAMALGAINPARPESTPQDQALDATTSALLSAIGAMQDRMEKLHEIVERYVAQDRAEDALTGNTFCKSDLYKTACAALGEKHA